MTIIIHSSRKRKVKLNLAKFLFSILFIFSCVFGTVSIFGTENTAMSAYEHCDTVIVTAGDTLWTIANEYNNGEYDTRVIVNDIITLNELPSAQVHVGQTLDIPGKYSVK